MDRKVPIKFFAKRENDNSRTEGGGGKTPKWVLEGEELIEKSIEITNFLINLAPKFNERKEKFVPISITTKLISDAKAKSHRSELAGLFENKNSKNNLIGMIGDDEVIIKIDNVDSLTAIEEKVRDYKKNSYGISCIDNINIFKPNIKKSEVSEEYKIKLLNYKNYNLNEAVMNSFVSKCSKLGVIIQKKNYSSELLIYKTNKINKDILMEFEKMPYVHSVSPMPKYKLDYEKGIESKSNIKISPEQGKNYVTVGILDSGIEKIDQLKEWIDEERMSSYPENLIDTSHGTFVAGVILYGDLLEERNFTGLNGCKIFDGNIFPDFSKEIVTEDELIDNIREIIETKHKDIKIWNMSGGAQEEIDENEFSDFAIALDAIQDEYGVIICKSAANCCNFLKGYPKKRIAKSADSVRAITVGSVAHKKGEFDLAEKNYPSPFTRIGRGPSCIIKPELVHYGGNAGVKDGELIKTGVKSFDKNGNITSDIGTSFSTPRVTGLLAALTSEIQEDFDPLLLKALAIHSANYGENVNMPDSDKLNQMGYGVPKNVREILYNDPNEITLIMRDTLEKSKFIDILDFPYPNSLKVDDYYTGQIVATLVYNPILDANQASEYCQSNIDLFFGSYDKKIPRNTEKPTILNPIGKDNNKNVLINTLYSQKAIKNPETEFAKTERMLISYGDKYYPVKKYAVDLSEMTPANKEKWLHGDKKWFLKLTGNYRHNIEKEYELNCKELSQEFCLIITIKDPKKTVNVYDDVTQLLEYNNFWHNNIKLSQNVNINIEK